MRIKRLLQLGASTLISLSSLLTINLSVAHAATATWTGLGSDSNFSTPENWQGNANPSSGDVLTFPASAANHSPVNDISGATFPLIQFTGGTGTEDGYDITGSAITVGNINDGSNTAYENMIRVNITVASDSLFASANNYPLVIGYPGAIGNTVTVNAGIALDLQNITLAAELIGDDTTLVTVDNTDAAYGSDFLFDSPDFLGNIHLIGGDLYIYGLYDSAQLVLDDSKLLGEGSAGETTISSTSHFAPGASPGCFTVSQLTMNGTYDADIEGATTPCADYDQITVSNGQIVLNNPTLNVVVDPSFTPAVGQTFTLVNNAFGGPISGTFNGLPEGSTFKVGNTVFSITYLGHGNNDVVLTVVDPSTAVTANVPKAPNTGMRLVKANGAALALTALSTGTLLYLSRRKSLLSSKR